MGHGRVNRDHQVEVGDNRRGIGKVLQLVAEIDQAHRGLELLHLLGRLTRLQRVEGCAFQVRQRRELRQWDGTPAIEAVLWAAGPRQPDPQCASWRRCLQTSRRAGSG